MKRIFKYCILVDGEWHKIDMPLYSTIIHTNSLDASMFYFWTLTEITQPPINKIREFRVFKTGECVDNHYCHRGSVQTLIDDDVGNLLEYHLFEKV